MRSFITCIPLVPEIVRIPLLGNAWHQGKPRTRPPCFISSPLPGTKSSFSGGNRYCDLESAFHDSARHPLNSARSSPIAPNAAHHSHCQIGRVLAAQGQCPLSSQPATVASCAASSFHPVTSSSSGPSWPWTAVVVAMAFIMYDKLSSSPSSVLVSKRLAFCRRVSNLKQQSRFNRCDDVVRES